MATTGQRIKEARLAAGMKTQKPLAEACGVTVQTVSQWETGKTKPGPENYLAISRLLKKPVEWLMCADDNHIATAQLGRKVNLTPVRVVGETGAERWLSREKSNPSPGVSIGHVMGRWEQAEQFAYKISGKSMDQSGINDGDYVICVNFGGLLGAHGDIVIVERMRDSMIERTCRKVFVFEDRYELRHNSTDPDYQDVIVIPKPPTEDGPVKIVGLVISVQRFIA